MKFIKICCLLFLAGILNNGCSVEKYYANQFVRTTPEVSILILNPDFLFKTNIKAKSVVDERIGANQDSIMQLSRPLLNEIIDTIFLKDFIQSFSKIIKEYGINVFESTEMEKFLNTNGNAYIVNFAQMELEEYFHKKKFKENQGEIIYYQDFALNAASLNVWIEISKVESKTKNPVLFTNYFISDKIEGDFKTNPLTGDVKFVYTRTNILPEKVSGLAGFSGQKTAIELYDFFMNAYVKEQLSDFKGELQYYHYNREIGKLIPAVGSNLVPVEKK